MGVDLGYLCIQHNRVGVDSYRDEVQIIDVYLKGCTLS